MTDWIRRGLRFECQPDCGKCCTNEAREGSVFLEAFDVERLARRLGITPQAFAAELTTGEDDERELAQRDGACVFLEEGRCTVYEDRPIQCRVYPFFPLDGFSPIESEYTWRYEKRFCPGIGKGRLYRKAEIEERLRGRLDVAGFDSEAD